MVKPFLMRRPAFVLGCVCLVLACADCGNPADPFNPDDVTEETIIAGHETVAGFIGLVIALSGKTMGKAHGFGGGR